ncbi:bifunctional DNA-formamidopyrimidine glycosylase/DNA-(apurinic or apyrimidinic site) lyase [Patescibacteria group bacterium]|nr:bifunctional DNA-formamidopyrimidine glycosylase/DNA-(apurinic or apyrimidinic site) lyase [Patescibacteria group bacterium]
MPELPEVETICRQLNKVLAGQRIKSLRGVSLQVEGKKILGVKRKAKMIIIELSKGESLLIHLKMTGQLIYNGKENKYTRAIFTLDKGRLYFNDLRKFGWIKLVTNKELKQQLVKLPPDVVDKEFTPHLLQNILRSSGQAIKTVLMDQSKMGGVGNIYANEILFCAGIDPQTPANTVGLQVRNLQGWIKKVINQGIKYGGSTASDENFVNARGEPGKFQEHFLVYENKNVCKKCKTKISKIKLGGRGTYYCPGCQK